MATALVLQHTADDGPGALATWLPEAGVGLEVLRLWAGDTVPTAVGHDALVVLGGPMSATAGDGPQPAERALIAAAVAAGTPVLGICLGAQLLAVAAGGTVAPHPDGPEYGWGLVTRLDNAVEDPVLSAVPFLPDVIQWHHDRVVDLPPGAVPLCRGTHTEHQAFRVGAKAWGLQFHIECDEAQVARWAADDDVDLERTWRPAVERFGRVVRGLFTGALL